ncbi:MAG: ABC transporter ATP-binding protein [Gammaproteobacteria bacterium]
MNDSTNAAAVNAGARPVLEVREATKSYGSNRALDALSLQVNAGEFVALLGPNVAGKTTLFQLLTGLFSADAGSIEIDGFDIRRQPVKALARIGVVFQQPTLDLDLSVRANLSFHTRLHGIHNRGARGRIDSALEALGLAESAKNAARSLSGGNRRKVELARALLHDPELLLMDEATVGLDPASRRLLLETVHDLCSSRGMAVLWTTHLVDEAEHADRVLVLHKGKLLSEGTPQALCEETGQAKLADAFLTLTAAGGPARNNTAKVNESQ